MKKNKPYKIIMSHGDSIKIDADELPGVLQAINEGNVHVLRQGVFNPSFFISIVKDQERMRSFMEDTKYSDEESKKRRLKGPEKLESIFKDTEFIEQIGQGNDGLIEGN